MNNKTLAVLQPIFFIAMIVVNALANILPINGLNTGEVSALYPNLFVPAGFTFGIWSVIYLFLLLWVVYSGMLLWKGEEKDPIFQHVQKVAPLFLLTCVLNASWIIAWHYLMGGVSFVIMVWFLRSLIKIYRVMQLNRSSITGWPLLILYIPFVIYLAWICVATIANATAVLVYAQWNGFGIEPWLWSCIMIVIAFLLTSFFTYIKGEFAFGLVVAWAMFGIYKGQFEANATVGYTAIICSILCLVFALVGFLRWNKKTPLEGII